MMKTLTKFLALAVLMTCSAALAASFPKGSPPYETNLGNALARAKEEGKPVVVIFSADWCLPCQMMKKEVFPSSEVKKFHDRFVWAYLDIDEESNAAAVTKYNVGPIPHIEFLNKNGKKAHRELGAPPTEQFVSILKQVLKKTGVSEKVASPAAAATAKNK